MRICIRGLLKENLQEPGWKPTIMDPQGSLDKSINTVHSIEEKQLVRNVREEGDRKAFEKIFRIYYKRLHAFAYTYLKRRESAEDVVQTVFLRIWENREAWDPPGSLKNYLFAAIRNEALNQLKHLKVVSDSMEEVLERYPGVPGDLVSEEETDQGELREAIRGAINQLPERCREIYLLNRRSGLTYTEIADHLEVSVNTVSTQMGRALKLLRKHLSDFIPLVAISALSKMMF